VAFRLTLALLQIEPDGKPPSLAQTHPVWRRMRRAESHEAVSNCYLVLSLYPPFHACKHALPGNGSADKHMRGATLILDLDMNP
jgi:hypothetical protein